MNERTYPEGFLLDVRRQLAETAPRPWSYALANVFEDSFEREGDTATIASWEHER